jgi:hypothetical protein
MILRIGKAASYLGSMACNYFYFGQDWHVRQARKRRAPRIEEEKKRRAPKRANIRLIGFGLRSVKAEFLQTISKSVCGLCQEQNDTNSFFNRTADSACAA